MPGLQRKLNNQHAPNQAAKHPPVRGTAELIRRHAAEQEHSPDMRLLIKNLSGKAWSMKVHKSWDIGAVKRLIQIVDGPPPDMIRLIQASRQLEDKKLLSDYDIPDASIVHVILRLGGD